MISMEVIMEKFALNQRGEQIETENSKVVEVLKELWETPLLKLRRGDRGLVPNHNEYVKALAGLSHYYVSDEKKGDPYSVTFGMMYDNLHTYFKEKAVLSEEEDFKRMLDVLLGGAVDLTHLFGIIGGEEKMPEVFRRFRKLRICDLIALVKDVQDPDVRWYWVHKCQKIDRLNTVGDAIDFAVKITQRVWDPFAQTLETYAFDVVYGYVIFDVIGQLTAWGVGENVWRSYHGKESV